MGAVLVFGVLCAVLINFVWLVLLYFFAGIAVWTCVILVLLSTLCGTRRARPSLKPFAAPRQHLRRPGNAHPAEPPRSHASAPAAMPLNLGQPSGSSASGAQASAASPGNCHLIR